MTKAGKAALHSPRVFSLDAARYNVWTEHASSVWSYQELECDLMQIQVNTDNQTQGSAELTRYVEDVVKDALGRFGDRITRVEVHLTDENSNQKSADNDKRCVMEARLAGLQPIAVSDEGSSLEQALEGAAKKLERTLSRTLERRDDPKGRTSFAGDPTT